MPYVSEHSCRLRDPDELDIIGSGERKHDGKTYRVIYGKPNGGDGSVEQAYRYPVGEWSEAEARVHCREHGGSFEPASREAAVRLEFYAAVTELREEEDRRLATFYLMNTSLNRNNWRVTDKALEEALPTLLGKYLNCIPGYRVNHVHEPLQVGRWIGVEKPDSYALTVAEITDDIAWEKISNREWGPISVVIKAYRVTCSKCGQDITAEPDEHIKSGEGHEVVESFVFDRVDFVSEPAYPQAGVLVMRTAGVIPFKEARKAPKDEKWDFDASQYDIEQLRRACAWYDSEKPDVKESYKLTHHRPDGVVVWRGVAQAMQVLLGARGGVDIPAGDRRGVYNHLVKHYRQFEEEPPEYHAQSNMDGPQGAQGNDPNPEEKREKERMAEEVKELRQNLADLKEENKTLKEKLERLEAERHMEKVKATVEARLEAGLTRDREAETERLKGLDEETLALLREDAERVAEKVAKASTPSGPKAKYTAERQNAFDSAVEDMREKLFGYRKEAGN